MDKSNINYLNSSYFRVGIAELLCSTPLHSFEKRFNDRKTPNQHRYFQIPISNHFSHIFIDPAAVKVNLNK